MFSKTVEDRLSYLELCLYWKGSVNRIDLRSKFEISVPQATQDFRSYLKLAPKNIIYDKNERAYIPIEKTFNFKFKENRPENILNILTGNNNDKDCKNNKINDCVYNLKPYIKQFDPGILTKVTRAVLQDNKFLKIEYQSLQSSEPEGRMIYPTSFGYFKGRYHIRAYCFSRNEYRDFVLSRIISVEYKDKVNKKVPDDIEANSTVAAIIKPHSKLSDTQKRCIELEYGMKDGFACITVEKHKLLYLLDELNLVYPELEPPYTALELVNREDINFSNSINESQYKKIEMENKLENSEILSITKQQEESNNECIINDAEDSRTQAIDYLLLYELSIQYYKLIKKLKSLGKLITIQDILDIDLDDFAKTPGVGKLYVEDLINFKKELRQNIYGLDKKTIEFIDFVYSVFIKYEKLLKRLKNVDITFNQISDIMEFNPITLSGLKGLGVTYTEEMTFLQNELNSKFIHLNNNSNQNCNLNSYQNIPIIDFNLTFNEVQLIRKLSSKGININTFGEMLALNYNSVASLQNFGEKALRILELLQNKKYILISVWEEENNITKELRSIPEDFLLNLFICPYMLTKEEQSLIKRISELLKVSVNEISAKRIIDLKPQHIIASLDTDEQIVNKYDLFRKNIIETLINTKENYLTLKNSSFFIQADPQYFSYSNFEIDSLLTDFFKAYLEKLNGRELTIFKRRIGVGGNQLTLEELSEKLKITRERVRQLQVCIESDMISKLPIHSKVLKSNFEQINCFELKESFPKLYFLFNEQDYLKNFLESCCNEKSFKIDVIDKKLLNEFIIENPSPFSLDQLSEYLINYHKFNHKYCENYIKKLEKLGFLYQGEDGFYPKKLDKKSAIQHILAGHDEGLTWAEICAIENQYDFTAAKLVPERINTGNINDEVRFHSYGSGKFRHNKYLKVSNIDIGKFIDDLKCILMNYHGETALLKTLMDDYNSAENKETIEYYSARYLVRQFGEKYNLFFSGASNNDTASLNRSFNQISTEEEIYLIFKYSTYPLSVEEVFPKVSTESIGSVRMKISELVNKSKIMRYDKSKYLLTEKALEDINYKKISDCVELIISSSHLPFTYELLSNLLKDNYNIEINQFLLGSFAELNPNNFSWNKSKSFISKQPLKFNTFKELFKSIYYNGMDKEKFLFEFGNHINDTKEHMEYLFYNYSFSYNDKQYSYFNEQYAASSQIEPQNSYCNFLINCPNCGIELEAEEENIGQEVTCPDCSYCFILEKDKCTFSVKCPNCEVSLEADKQNIGMKVSCPKCDYHFILERNIPIIEKQEKIEYPDMLEEVDINHLVLSGLKLVVIKPYFNQKVLDTLQSNHIPKIIFNIDFPVLVKASNNNFKTETYKSLYKTKLRIFNNNYFVYNQWTEDHRAQFITWLQKFDVYYDELKKACSTSIENLKDDVIENQNFISDDIVQSPSENIEYCLSFQKRVDWSTFHSGITIPREYHSIVEQNLTGELVQGQSLPIIIKISDQEFQARILSPKFSNPFVKQVIQILWSKSSPIAKNIQAAYKEIYEALLKHKRDRSVLIEKFEIKLLPKKDYFEFVLGNRDNAIYKEDNLKIKDSLIVLLEKYFPNGIRPDSKIDLNKLKRYYNETNQGSSFPSDINVSELLRSIGIIHGEKVYIVPSHGKAELIKLLNDLIEQDFHLFYYEEFYEIHFELLHSINVFSVTLLKKLLKIIFPSLFYSKSYFSTNNNVSTINEVLRQFENTICLSYEQIKENLTYIPIDKIKQILAQNKEFVWVSTGHYTLLKKIKIDSDELESLKVKINNEISNHGFISINSLNLPKSNELNFGLSKTAVNNGVFEIHLSNIYDKHGNIITSRDKKLNSSSILKDHCSKRNEITLEELLELEKEINKYISGQALYTAYETMIRIDKNKFVADSEIDFNSKDIDNSISFFVNSDVIPLKAITNFISFPYIDGYKWNLYLLESYCRRFSRKFKFHCLSVNSCNVGAICRKSAGFNNYTTALAFASANANIELNEREVGKFLYECGYIARRTGIIRDIVSTARNIRERNN